MSRLRILRTLPGGGGGNRYQDDMARVLSPARDVEIVPVYAGVHGPGRRLRILAAIHDLARSPPADTVTVVDLLGAAAIPRRRRGPFVALVHHVDPAHGRGHRRLLSRILTQASLSGLRRADRVVVVADYWRRWLAARGVDRITRVPNAFDPAEYVPDATRREALRRELSPDGRPLVYLGNCRREKGVVEAYAALRDTGWRFVTSGERRVHLPVPNLELDHPGYLALLAAADVVLTMSRFPEGWNRTAHEAMLLGTPVVGSGAGGMRELLEGGGQRICPSPASLPVCVRETLARAGPLGEAGRRFASRFTLDAFAEGWGRVVSEVEGR